MPGSVKISGAQRTVAAPYVKVNGTWRTASIAYTKVAGTWRQWYAAKITDNFNRADSASLGTVSNGVTSWSTLQGAWAISSNTAVGTGTYPLAVVTNPLQLADYELKLDNSVGTGLAFWVTDANNWWAVVTETTSSISYSCSSGTLSGTNCISSSTYTAPISSTYTYTCGTYTPGSLVYYAPAPTWTKVSSQCGAQCYDLNYSCFADGCYRPSSECDGNTGRSGYGCSTSTSSSCSQGTYDGSSCVCTGGGTPYCYGSDTLSGNTCTTTSSSPATATTNYAYTVKVLQSTAGSVAVRGTYTVPAATASLKLLTSNSSVVITSYASAGQSGASTSHTYVATSPTRTSTAGIIGAGTVDNFELK